MNIIDCLLPYITRLFRGIASLVTLISSLAVSICGQVQISEFSASNNSGLTDEEGFHEDWIELVNLGNKPEQLEGWSLTDDAGDPRQWVFPRIQIAPKGYLVVFASGKDRRDPQAPLHTNFRLSDEGEFLMLAPPNQSAMEHAFAPSYPRQFRDVSYGFGMHQETIKLVTEGAKGKMLVPEDGLLGEKWTHTGFDDGTWLPAINGVGYDTGLQDTAEDSYAERVMATKPSLYWRLNETQGSLAANLGSMAENGQGRYEGGLKLGRAGPRPPATSGMEPENHAPSFDGVTSHVRGPRSLLNDREAFTMAGWIRPNRSQSNRTGLWGQNDAVEFGFINNSTLQLWSPSGSVELRYPHRTGEWHHITTVGSGKSLEIYVDGIRKATAPGGGNNYGRSEFNFNVGGGGVFDARGNGFSGQIDEVSFWKRALSSEEVGRLFTRQAAVHYQPHLATDIQERMLGINSSVYLRFPFEIEDPSNLDQLFLMARFDDGLVAWINGIRVGNLHAPDQLTWDASATQRQPDMEATNWRKLDLHAGMSALVSGSNVLALQGLNIDKDNTDFLLSTELKATRLGKSTDTGRYFLQPSPGEPNGAGAADMGPILSDLVHHPNQPTENQDMTIRVKASSAFAPLQRIHLHYRIQFGSTVTIKMHDDGSNGDSVAGDQVWNATIPSSATSAGQLIRYYITAVDTEDHESRWPLYSNRRDSEAYQGTVVADPSINSALPLVQLFVENVSSADTSSGTGAALYYGNELYDNVRISLHGQSSRGFPKKSYNLDFTADHYFRYRLGERRVKDIRLMTNWGDKAKLRNTLAYEMIKRAGSHGHFSFQVRVQRNARFFSIADMMEDGDDRWLERIGLDPQGALYKMYNNLGNAGGNEKKTRRHENTRDLQELVSTLSENRSLRRRTLDAWDIIDLPQTISYFAALALCSSQDHGHKNYYLYRDSEASGEWSLLPWDVDLSWGRNWLDAKGYFTDTLFQNNELDFYNRTQQGKPSNRLYELIFDAPPFRSMVLRRLRTIMDQLLQSPNTSTEKLIIEARIHQMLDAMDPRETRTSDADLDHARWGSWGNRNRMRTEAERILSQHLPGRRKFLFEMQAHINREAIPDSQPMEATLSFGTIDFNPKSGRQNEEFIQLNNSNHFAFDLSGWILSGAVRHTFRPGTVIPAQGSLYITPDVSAFRLRKTSPHGGQGVFLQGNYQGQLNARGETLQLENPDGMLWASRAFKGNPSAAQQSLRVTELFYHPDRSEWDGMGDANPEYLELTNTGTEIIDLTGIRFTRGIRFDFTNSQVLELSPGMSVVVVGHPTGFESRFGQGVQVAGSYQGTLDNGGESIRLEDAFGEKILEFSYDDAWYPESDGGGYSIVIQKDTIPWDQWGESAHWIASTERGGTPGRHDVPLENLSDTDGDDLPDDWEIAHGLDPLIPAGMHGSLGDKDGDEATNWEEYQAGTHPDDPQSVLRLLITESATNPGDFQLGFDVKAGRHYQLETLKLDLGVTWIPITKLPKQPHDTSIQIPITADHPAGQLYRLKVYATDENP
jgi:hypothetical protein